MLHGPGLMYYNMWGNIRNKREKSKNFGGKRESPGHTNDFKNSFYCSSVCAGHNELE